MRKLNKMIVMTVVLSLLLSFSVTNAQSNKTVTIPVFHEILGDETSEDFTFVIQNENDESPMPSNPNLTIKGNGKAEFKLSFDDVGRYDYSIYEKPGSNNSIIYDQTKYKVIIVLKYIDGEIISSVILEDGSATKPEKVSFKDVSNKKPVIVDGKKTENTDKKDDPVRPSVNPTTTYTAPVVNKIIKNNKAYKDKFTFKLEGNGVKGIASINGEGKAKFPNIIFTKKGQYKFTISENKPSASRWDYDDSKQSYIVDVIEKDGKLVAVENKNSFKFVNSPKLLRKAERMVNLITGHPDNPQTGDTSNVFSVILLMLGAGILTVVILKNRS